MSIDSGDIIKNIIEHLYCAKKHFDKAEYGLEWNYLVLAKEDIKRALEKCYKEIPLK